MKGWNVYPEVASPVGRPLSDLLAEGPRRMPLDGFEPVYRDLPDYILRCTHRIWEQKNAGLCRTHYSDDCPLHTAAGPAMGAQTVTQNTIGALSAYSDRIVVGEDVIWSEDAPGTFLSSHRIMSQATQMADEGGWGAAAMLPSGVMTMADCLCRENRIVEEWLARDNLRAVWQLGLDGWEVAHAQAAFDLEGDQSRHGWRAAWIAAIRAGDDDVPVAVDHPAAPIAHALWTALVDDLYGEAAAVLSPAVELRWPSNRAGFGRGYWIGCLTQLRAALHRPSFRIEHVAARPLPHGDVAVAVRWAVAGTHAGLGVWGAPTGRDLLLMAISHYRVRDGLVVEDATVFDELAMLRQVAGGLGS